MTKSAPHTRQLSISAALIGNLTLLALVIGALCAWLMAEWGSTNIRQEANKRLTLTASSIASQITQAMVERHHEIRRLRDLFEHEMRDATPEQKRQVMERLQADHQHFSWLGLVNIDGQITIGTGHLLEAASVAGRNWFEGARQAPVFFGNIHPAKLLEQHVRNADGAPLYLLDISLPLHDANGEIEAVLGSHFNWRMIEEIVRRSLAALTELDELSVAIIDADGAILFDSRGTAGKIDPLMKGTSGAQMLEANWPGEEGNAFLSIASVPAGRDFNGLGWRIAVRESSARISSVISRMKWEVALASLLTGMLFSCLAVFVVRPVTRPLLKLVGELKEFGDHGTLPSPGEQGIAEIADLNDAFAEMAAHVLGQRTMLHDTQAEIVRTLGRAGEFRDNETGNHVLRMSLCCEHLAILAGWDAEAAERLRLASQMHDVGKIGIPDHVLLKPGRFDSAEREQMEQHSVIGARILTGIDTPLTLMARTIALTHHEKWDGSGYPNHLSRTDIPQEGRIAALCDVFDALLSSRPYKEGWPLDKVVDFLAEQAGQHFDPELVALFLTKIDDFVAIRCRYQDEPAS